MHDRDDACRGSKCKGREQECNICDARSLVMWHEGKHVKGKKMQKRELSRKIKKMKRFIKETASHYLEP
jgi:hypothetical protein